MTPRNTQPSGQYDFFKKRTDEVAHKSHPLVILSDKFNWEVFDKSFGSEFDPKNGRPGLSKFCQYYGIPYQNMVIIINEVINISTKRAC